MLKMQHNKATGEIILTHVKSGHRAIFDNYFDAWLYVKYMRDAFAPGRAKHRPPDIAEPLRNLI